MKKETGIAVFICTFVLVALLTTLTVLAQSNFSFKRGDIVVLEKSTELVVDWNASVLDKPSCWTQEGSRFIISGFSSVDHGRNIESTYIMWLTSMDFQKESCEGWINIDNENIKKITNYSKYRIIGK